MLDSYKGNLVNQQSKYLKVDVYLLNLVLRDFCRQIITLCSFIKVKLKTCYLSHFYMFTHIYILNVYILIHILILTFNV